MPTDTTAAGLSSAQMLGIISIADDAIICLDSAQKVVL
jgi:hypothetical protein